MIFLKLLLLIFIFTSIFVTIVISSQDNQAKLGTGFGVHDTSDSSMFGASTPKVVKKVTTTLIIIYFILSIIISSLVSWEGRKIYVSNSEKHQYQSIDIED